MNWVDLVVLAILALSGLLGLLRGLVREAFGLGAWVGAAAAAYFGFPVIQPFLRRELDSPDLADILAFVLPFVAVLIVLGLVAGLVGRAVRRSALGSLDRTLGLLFGLARGAALLVAAYIIAGMGLPSDRWPPPVLQARSLPLIYRGAVWAATELPPEYRPKVEPPAGPAAPSSEALLRVPAPAGRLFSPPHRQP